MVVVKKVQTHLKWSILVSILGAQVLVSNTLAHLRKPSTLKEKAVSGAGTGYYKMNLEHFVVSESKVVIFFKRQSYHKEIIVNLKGFHW